jgi:hypothetical protein
MDGKSFDRITRLLATINPRREAIRVLAGTGFAAVAARLGADGATGKKRCRNIGQSCGARKRCCNESGLVRCEEFPANRCQNSGKPTGKRCCGQVGARCDPEFGTPIENPIDSPNSRGNCSCCDPLYCGKQANGKFRCQIEDT